MLADEPWLGTKNDLLAPPDSGGIASSQPADASIRVMPNNQQAQERQDFGQVIIDPVAAAIQNRKHIIAEPVAGTVVGQSPLNETEWDHLRQWELVSNDEEIDLASLDRLEDDEHDAYEGFAEDDPHDDNDGHGPRGEHVEHAKLAELERPDSAVQVRSKLSGDQIVEVINQCIAHYQNVWVPNKEVMKEDQVEYDTKKMWQDAEAEGKRSEIALKHESEQEYYRQRLDKLCDEVLRSPATTEEKVRRQCFNLEITVNSMELAKWLSLIYRSEPESNSDTELNDTNLSDHSDQPAPSSIFQNQQARLSMEIEGAGLPSRRSPEAGKDLMNFEKHVGYANASAWPLVKSDMPLFHSTNTFSDEPENASVLSVQSWRWADLIGGTDRKRIVSKTVHEMGVEERELIRYRIKHVGRINIEREIPAYIEMLLKGGSKMPGVLPQDLRKIEMLTRLFFSWWFCDNCFRQDMTLIRIEGLQQCLEAGSLDPRIFCNYLNKIMSTTFNEEALRYPGRPSQAEIIVISDDED